MGTFEQRPNHAGRVTNWWRVKLHRERRKSVNKKIYRLLRKLTWKVSKDFWTTQRAETYVACNGICWLCGYRVSVDKFSIDHIVPQSLGGSDELYNLRLVHGRCHIRHHRNNHERINKLLAEGVKE